MISSRVLSLATRMAATSAANRASRVRNDGRVSGVLTFEPLPECGLDGFGQRLAGFRRQFPGQSANLVALDVHRGLL
jgi:hypothetical protein